MPQYPCPTDATIAPRSYTLAMRLCSSELCVKSNMAPCPPARHIASYVFGSTDRMGGVFFRSAMRSWLFSQDFALSLRNGNFRERGSKGTSPHVDWRCPARNPSAQTYPKQSSAQKATAPSSHHYRTDPHSSRCARFS